VAAASPAGKPAAAKAAPAKVRQADRSDVRKHEGFLSYGGYRWLWIAVALCAVSIAGYVMIDAEPRPRGGTMYGYTLGTIGALLIVWLSLFGIRKRAITTGVYSLKAWLSAHVYLGLSLLVIGTLHAGLHFGWNVHTLAYGLMVLVIVSGMFGAAAYAILPQLLSANRGETTQRQWLETIRSLDSQLRDAAQPLDRTEADLVRLSTEQTDIGGSLWSRLTGDYSGCKTRRAVEELARIRRSKPGAANTSLDQIDSLLKRKQETLAQARRHIRIKTILEVWLYVHVPITFALLAALTAHIVSVFFYW
jgi:hypothetical protein